MRISAKAISTFNHVNSFVLDSQWQIRAGEANTLYFQLVDLDQSHKCPFRYIAALRGTTLTVTFPSIDNSAIITVNATMADPADTSLWYIELTDAQVPSSGNVNFALTEGSVTRRFSVLNFMSVEFPGNNGSC